MRAGKVPAPSIGDCWYCSMREDSGGGTRYGVLHEDGTLSNQATVAPGTVGRTMGEIGGNKEHILSHIKEKYFVPSLLLRTLEVLPYSQAMKWAVGETWWPALSDKKFFSQDSFTWQQISKSLTRYIYRQLSLTS
jgi:hypothetical protein